jgi:hypothetical protein
VYQTVCDVAEFHDLDLSDQQIAANLPVLWSIAGDLFRSSLVQLGIEPPQKLITATVTKALWELHQLDLPETVSKTRETVSGDQESGVPVEGSRRTNRCSSRKELTCGE